ncbi:MAG: NADH:ubiquinone reductase (Na(+)-transporting) subunit D [Spirochaetes bacterium]|nr:NADH:ubiquinone reductase (Na(+)-transporting) subunit D [Spirochaetota bacterium]
MNKTMSIFKENIWDNNPVIIQILGICSTLAVTNNFRNTFIMTISLVFVTGFSNLTISLSKGFIPRKVRMIIQTLVIASYVIIVDLVLKAYLSDVSKALGPYVGLIITNCIIMGRAEAFAQSNPPFLSLWDGIVSGLGYMFVLLPIAFVRELLGFGSFMGIPIMPEGFTTWTIMIMAPSGFFMLAVYIWIVKSIRLSKETAK